MWGGGWLNGGFISLILLRYNQLNESSKPLKYLAAGSSIYVNTNKTLNIQWPKDAEIEIMFNG